MKSSFSWPGRPPAEMISRNANRLLTSILDGSQKRGAFCTSTLDGTLKRGAFCTSTLDGTLKRGAFCTSTLDGRLKRGAFCTSTLDGTLKRDAFCTSTLDGRLKRDAFLCTRVGAYCIRPTKRSRKGTRSVKGDQTHDSLSPTGPFGRAYAIRPYHATSKRDAFYTSYLVATLKRGAFCTSYLVATPKRGAFCTSTLDGTPKRGAFCTSTLDGTPKRGAFCTSTLDGTPKRGAFGTSILDGTPKRGAFCTSILDGALKRDAFFGRQGRGVSNTPSKRSRMGTRVAKGSQTRDSLSPAGPFDGAYAIRPYHATSKRGAFASSFSIVVFSSFIFLCLSSLFSSGRSSFRCSVMCAP